MGLKSSWATAIFSSPPDLRGDEAEALLDDAYDLGAEGGIVDCMLATFGTGTRLKFTRGDKPTAHRRLAEGLEIARQLELP